MILFKKFSRLYNLKKQISIIIRYFYKALVLQAYMPTSNLEKVFFQIQNIVPIFCQKISKIWLTLSLMFLPYWFSFFPVSFDDSYFLIFFHSNRLFCDLLALCTVKRYKSFVLLYLFLLFFRLYQLIHCSIIAAISFEG